MTSIEWTKRPGTIGETLNPIRARNRATGKLGWWCSHVNGDCANCYAETLNVKGGDSGGNGIAYKAQMQGRVEVFLDERTLQKPLHWRQPRTIFLCSMTDIFADFVPDAWLDKIFAVAALCPQHTFIMLTKRPKRMREYLSSGLHAPILDMASLGRPEVEPLAAPGARIRIANALHAMVPVKEWTRGAVPWPLPNVWIGASCGTQNAANDFVPDLLATPAAVRFLSVEPMRGPVDLCRITRETDHSAYVDDALSGFVSNGHGGHQGSRIDWVICGGESGPRARPMHSDWARRLRDQCAAAGVPFFFKQWGEWTDWDSESPWVPARGCAMTADGRVFTDARAINRTPGDTEFHLLQRVGKKAAGRELDGRTHDDFPRVEALGP